MPDQKIQLIIEVLSRTDAAFNDLKRHLKDAQGETDELHRKSNNLDAGVGRLVARYASLTASVSGVVLAATSAISYLAGIETATLGIGAAFMVGGKYIDATSKKALDAQDALKAATGDAKEIVGELQYANLQTIATLDELINAYQVTLPVALAKGFNRQQVKDFTVAMVQAAGAIGLQMNQISEETRSILTGAIDPRTSRIATVLGLRNEDIAQFKGNAQGLFDYLMGKLSAYRIAGVESQKTWAGLWSNTKDIALQALGQGFEPLFDAVKGGLQEVADKIVTVNNETKKIEWNPEFLKGVAEFRDGLRDILAILKQVPAVYSALPDEVTGAAGAGIVGRLLFGSWGMAKALAVLHLLNDVLGKLPGNASAGGMMDSYREGAAAAQNIIDVLAGRKDWNTGAAIGGPGQFGMTEWVGPWAATFNERHPSELPRKAGWQGNPPASDAEALARDKKLREEGDKDAVKSAEAVLEERAALDRTLVELNKKRYAEDATLRAEGTKGEIAAAEERLAELAHANAVINETNAQRYRNQKIRREGEIESQLAELDLAERLGRAHSDTLTERIRLQEELLAGRELSLAGIDKATDPTGYYAQATAIQGTQKAIADLKREISMQNPFAAISLGLNDVANKAKEIGQQLYAAIDRAFSGMTDALTDFVMTGKGSFTDLANTIIRDMIRIQIQAQVTGPLSSGIGGFLTSLFSPSGMGGVSGGAAVSGGYAGGSFAGFHRGGMGTEPTFFRIVPAAAMLPSLPRYHAGLGPGERLAVTTDDESTMTPGQRRDFFKLAAQYGSRDTAAEPGEVHVHLTINALDSRSVSQALAQHQAEIVGMVNIAYNRRGQRGPLGR